MLITPETGIHGYLANDPRLTRAEGQARFHARLGMRPRDRREPRVETAYLDLVLFGRPAELAHALYRRGDDIIALGRLIPAIPTPDGGQRDPQFIAERLAPDTNHHAVTIRRQPVPTTKESA
jgi:hypothetical protein